MYRESTARRLEPIKPQKSRPPYIEHETAETFNRNVIKPWFEIQPQERGFIDLYPEPIIARDISYVQTRKKAFAPEKLEKATTAEYAMLQGFGDEMWIPDASVTPCSEYDDIAKGVDFVISFEEDGKFIHLGVDTTIGNLATYEKKLKKIKKELEEGKLKKLKYFEADMPEAGRGKLELPAVILRVDPFQLREFRNAIAKKPKKRTELEENLVSFLRQAAVKEIKNQLIEEMNIVQSSRKIQSPEKKELLEMFEKILDRIPEK